jgi:hypothetical protein
MAYAKIVEVQLNVHVPREREALIARLDHAARRLGRPKNQVVLDAIERFLAASALEEGVGRIEGIPTFHMGAGAPFTRGDVYADRGLE